MNTETQLSFLTLCPSRPLVIDRNSLTLQNEVKINMQTILFHKCKRLIQDDERFKNNTTYICYLNALENNFWQRMRVRGARGHLVSALRWDLRS